DKYGYSQEMVDHTIRAAAERVAQVPVKEVFNWGRLVRQWLLVLATGVGVYLLLMVAVGSFLVATGDSFGGFFWRFNRTATVWAKRNALLMNRVYWPTQAYVQIMRAPGSTLKVARDDPKRPELEVHAFQWVIYDPDTVEGVRPLRLDDLKDLAAKGW